jgi:hypothetical protein
MPASPREEMRIVAARLQPLGVPFAFVGGAVMCLLVDHPEAMEFRRTKDVDVIVGITTYLEFAALEQRLRKEGFQHDTSGGAPICRWIVDGCRVDIMPQAPASLGMNTRWFPEVLRDSVVVDLGHGQVAKVVTPALFLATKLEAFNDRGKNDLYGSHDLEDIVTLVGGRENIVRDVAEAPSEIKRFVSNRFAAILSHADFQDALVGHVPFLVGDTTLRATVAERFRGIVNL